METNNEVCELLEEVRRTSRDALKRIVNLAETRQLQDIEWSEDRFLNAFSAALLQALRNTQEKSTEFAIGMVYVTHIVQDYPEFDSGIASRILSAEVALAVINRLGVFGLRDNAWQESQTTTNMAKTILPLGNGFVPSDGMLKITRRAYELGDKNERASIRASTGSVLARLSRSAYSQTFLESLPGNRCLEGAAFLLHFLLPIIAGFQKPLSTNNVSLFTDLILPLHRISGKRDTNEVLISLLHRDLVQCIVKGIEKAPNVLVDCVLKSILESWPIEKEGLSEKEVLFLHEVETLLSLEVVRNCISATSILKIAAKWASCIKSLNSFVCERALMFWKNPTVVDTLFGKNSADENVREYVCNLVCEPLLEHAIRHWNGTAVKMAQEALRYLLNNHKQLIVLQASKLSSWRSLNNVEDCLNQLLPAEENTLCSTQILTQGSTNQIESSAIPEKLCDVSFMNMVVGEELGEGSFSVVYRAYRVLKGKPRSAWDQYALKRIEGKHRDLAIQEIAAMDAVLHPNCTRLLGVYESERKINLVLELATLGDMHSVLIANGGTLSEDSAKFVSAEVAAGLGAIHEAGYVFSDLKPENVLVHQNGHVKLGDFGSARKATDFNNSDLELRGTLCYIAPEVFTRRTMASFGQQDQINTNKSNVQIPLGLDFWAFGCFIYFLLAGKPPIWAEEEQEHVEKVVDFRMDRYPDHFPKPAESLVNSLLEVDPVNRLGSKNGVNEIEDHSFFRSLGFPFSEAFRKPAPKFAPGKVQPKGGPWTRRAMSVVHAPMPAVYLVQTDAAAIEENVDDMGLSWISSIGISRKAVIVESNGSEIPQQEPPDFFARELSFRKTNPIVQKASTSQTSLGRKRKEGKYAVNGIDLTAG